jgi:hypothetical protein
MARCRAIGTETLADLGQYLPGLFLPEGYAVEGESAGADSVASSLREHRVEASG